jgi:hypothetical protein
MSSTRGAEDFDGTAYQATVRERASGVSPV